ncbi:MAG TPA: AI-2E family transporter [Gemmatimonadaceae bacterium]|nr:AI-2E family transporter [Gemmatimonadaceae bacterium]
MTDRSAEGPGDRRRVERRVSQRVADLTLPEFRRIILTSLLFAVVLSLFLWMVRVVVIAAILAVIVGAYVRPLYLWFLERVKRPVVAALITILIVVVPVLAAIAYSYAELSSAASYIADHEAEIVARIDAAIRRLPFFRGETFTEQIRDFVSSTSLYGARIVDTLQETIVEVTVSAAIFLFTLGYILTDAETVVAYIRSKLPPRYSELVTALEHNVEGVLYGAIYATLVTQTIKSLVIFAMNVAFAVPLAAVLALLSFVIGFFPIVGSWSVYVPVAIWLAIFREAYLSSVLVLVIGFLGNTLFISMYLRPKLAAEKSRVLNFYWMFIGLVTGVYTFGIVGILLGPIVIGLLKAVFDTVTAQTSWRLLDADGGTASATSDVLPAASDVT